MRIVGLPPHGTIGVGFETIRAGESYRWDGMQRGGNARKPTWLFQYTLSGWGIFGRRGSSRRVEPGEAFCAKIPSPHIYHNDPRCKEWRFFWILINHSYVTTRLLRQPWFSNTVVKLPDNSRAIEAASSIVVRIGGRADVHEIESALFRLMVELERHVFLERHPAEERIRMMEFVRHFVRQRLDQFISVDDLARAQGTSRSNFSHHFRRITSRSPAAVIREVRLQEAARLLEEECWSVKEVAARTGFSDANHLCKCFRSQLQTSPGNYRRLMGVSGNRLDCREK